MAAIRRHWLAALFGGVVLLAFVAWIIIGHLTAGSAVGSETAGGQVPAQGGQSSAPGGVYAIAGGPYSQIQAIRTQLSLKGADLAAMDCSQADAERVLGALRQWYDVKQAELATARTVAAKAARELRETRRKISVGPRDEQLILRVPGMTHELMATEKAHRELIKTAIPAVEAVLSDSSKAVWAAARANFTGSDYGYVPDLTPQQKKTLGAAYNAKIANASKSPEARTEAQTAYIAAENQTLTEQQKTALATIRANLRGMMPGVLAATRKIMPVPKELQPVVAR